MVDQQLLRGNQPHFLYLGLCCKHHHTSTLSFTQACLHKLLPTKRWFFRGHGPLSICNGIFVSGNGINLKCLPPSKQIVCVFFYSHRRIIDQCNAVIIINNLSLLPCKVLCKIPSKNIQQLSGVKVINTRQLITLWRQRERNSLRSDDQGLHCLCLLLTTFP